MERNVKIEINQLYVHVPLGDNKTVKLHLTAPLNSFSLITHALMSLSLIIAHLDLCRCSYYTHIVPYANTRGIKVVLSAKPTRQVDQEVAHGDFDYAMLYPQGFVTSLAMGVSSNNEKFHSIMKRPKGYSPVGS